MEELAYELHHLESLEDDWEPTVTYINCVIFGECIETEDSRVCQGKEHGRAKEMGAFMETLPIAEAMRKGLCVSSARFATNEAKARLEIQGVRHGPVAPEHWTPTPCTTTQRAALLMVTQHGATVVDIRGASCASCARASRRARR